MFKSPFRIGETLADALAARAVAANDLWQLRMGRRQTINVDVRAAAATCLGGEDMTLIRDADGQYRPAPISESVEHMVALTQPWQTADHRWFVPHFNLPHLERRVLDVLKCENTPESVAQAVRRWKADDLEEALAAVNACGGVVRTPEEWLAHPHGAYLASRPVVEITKIADSAPEPLPPGAQPLSGVRVLDLTRILAGPTAGIGMAEHGADVLMVTAPHLPQVPPFVRDTSHGKRSCFLDFNLADEAAQLRDLVREADVFIEGYRPHRLEAHGFGADDLVKLRPGLVYVSVNCYGSGGPFASRAGWDQVAQAVTGVSFTQGIADKAGQPKLTPVYLCDFLTGFLASFGAMIALARRAREGGSYRVQVSLCQSAMLLQRQGLLENFEHAPGRLSDAEFESYAVCDNNTIYGDLKSLGPVIRMSETPPRWSNTTPELGSDKAEWLPR
ncbi:CoA transferase [Paenibacillus brasilensis]|uniref:Crotonobetainyl-CoA:carnitine CoA-transferase CaiB-like acyl-CoA transferase n=1 Tax=Paenibacillus brasilensis TaxID=128574 RepID=A0ABU0L4X3_9BACL|nr:CoA transferase [Paenibacillus brasilensis]MDQ0496339.1 crotonobetainyl-CoA:carnitine CoA-transferase CaiB-like acyl-CoA transferase [Paenibacillus brasilensis]